MLSMFGSCWKLCLWPSLNLLAKAIRFRTEIFWYRIHDAINLHKSPWTNRLQASGILSLWFVRSCFTIQYILNWILPLLQVILEQTHQHVDRIITMTSLFTIVFCFIKHMTHKKKNTCKKWEQALPSCSSMCFGTY